MASSARLDELKKKFDENPRRYFAPLANEHRKSGDLDQAISLCRTHLPLQPGHISGHIVLAQALFEAGSLDESREIFHTALGLDPENLIALRYLGDIAKESHDIGTARTWYQRVLEVDPRNDEIVQLVRDLDALPSAPQEPGAEEPAEAVSPAVSSFAPPAAAASSPPPPAPEAAEARFAPLSLDEVDLDDSFSPPASQAAPNDTPAAPRPDGYAGEQSWNASQAGTEAPMLDEPGMDPFNLDPAGSVDALFDSSAEPAHDDFFLTELSGAHATADGAEPAPPASPEAWTPQAGAAASTPAPEATELDEASFYLEPAPEASPEPAPASEFEIPPVDAGAPSSAAETPIEPVSIPGADAFAAEYSTGSYDAIPEPEPNAEPVQSLAEEPTAEWHAAPPEVHVPAPAEPTAAVVPDDGLGLEVMEFVPPSSEAAAPPAYAPQPDADPMLGRTPAMATNEASATPAAFVTETMAELYLQQGFRSEALAVYRELLSRNPTDASLRERIEQLESGSISSIGMASVSEDVVEAALKRQAGRPARSVRSFFASLASRRAPGPRDDTPMPAPDAPFEETVDEAQPQPATAAEVAPPGGSTSEPAPVVEVSPSPRHDRITPLMSAAETLASFDPFGDAGDAGDAEPTLGAVNETAVVPNEPLAEFSNGMASPPRQTPLSTPAQAPAPAAASPEPPARRALENLFPDTPVAARTEAAAQTLATAFGRPEPQGRPTRAASNELSLDHVFRGAPEGAPPADGGFSFDQFFSDSRAPGGDSATPASVGPESGRSSGSSDAHDIEQFTAWLEGLKKK
jgi:tetratricopeptide (TPR) repeat protein